MKSRRFELRRPGQLSAFLQLYVGGKLVIMHYGYLGSLGHLDQRSFAGPHELDDELERLLELTLEQGYVEVELDLDTDTTPRLPAFHIPQLARHAELEASLISNPDDEDSWQVYGDWLHSRGDPRAAWLGVGESQQPEQISDDSCFGGLAPYLTHPDARAVFEARWRHGHIIEATLGAPDTNEPRQLMPWEPLAALLESPASRFLRRLWVGTDDGGYSEVSMTQNLEVLASFGELAALRELLIREREDFCDVSRIQIGALDSVLAAAPGLRKLEVRGAQIKLETLTHPSLEHLSIETGGLPPPTVRALARCELPMMRHLHVYFGSRNYGGGATIEDLLPLFTGAGLPRLEHLGLCNCEFQDALVTELARSPMLPRLRSVALSLGTMTDVGAAQLLSAASAFAHLEHLDVSRNSVSDAMLRRLRRALPNLHSSSQYSPTSVYVSVSE